MSSKKVSIKICEKCFLCHSIVLCQFCSKCTKCCPHSACRGQTAKFLADLAGPGCRSQSSSNPARGLHPPFPDPTKPHKNSHSRKLLCQSSQEQLPVRGIASAYRQKCCRTGSPSDLARVLQPTLFSPQTQQQMETYIGPQPSEPIPQSREIQDGNTGNHQNLPLTRGMGNVGGLQGCLFPHTDTETVPEIPQISDPGPNLPVQSSSLWSIHSTHGIHCNHKGSEANGHAQGYKNPPVPRRLVSKSQIPPGLSPTYSDTVKNMPGSRLVSEFGKIRAGTQTSLQLRRLPVRPQVRSGPTDTGPVAKPPGKDTTTFIAAGLSGPAVHVLDRSVNSHREASSLRPITHETHSVASQKQLEGTGILRKGHPSTQVPAPTFMLVAGRKQCPPRTTVTPYEARSANIYRRLKRRVGRSLKRVHGKRVLVGTRKQAAHKLPRAQSGSPSPQRVPKSLCGQNSPSGNRQYYGSRLHKQRRRHEVRPTLCPPVENLNLVFPQTGDPKGPAYPGPPQCDSRQAIQTGSDHPNRMVPPTSSFSTTMHTMAPASDRPICHEVNRKLPQFVCPVPDTLAVAVDALTLPWDDLDAYAFPPTAILSKVVEKLLDSPCKRLILIAPGWPNMPWFWDLVAMSSRAPLSLPNLPNLLTQPFNQIPHRNLTNLNLHAWLLEPQKSKNKVSLRQWQQELRLLKENQPDQSMRQSGPFLQSGATLIRWTSGHHL